MKTVISILAIAAAMVGGLGAGATLQACGAASPGAVITPVIDVANAVCTVLSNDLQNEPAWIKYICSIIDPATGASVSQVVKVPNNAAAKAAFESKVHMAGAVDGGGK